MPRSEKPKRGCLRTLFGAILLIFLCGWGIKSCGDWAFRPDTPEEAEARKKKEEEKEAKWKAEEAKQPERKKAIDEMIAKGVFSKVEYRQAGATIWVSAPFYLLSFDEKKAFSSVVYAYLATSMKNDGVFITLKDDRTGNSVGNYSQFGIEMK